MHETQRFWITWGTVLGVLLLWARCDAVAPEEEALLVVEAFVDAGEPLPTIRLWQTKPLHTSYAFDATTAVADADVVLQLGASPVSYEPVSGRPGWYQPVAPPVPTVPAHTPLSLDARWRGQHAEAESTIPPVLRLDSIRVDIPSTPVDGIILDSLFIDPIKLDSLQLDSLKTGAAQGLVYLVEVTLSWWANFDETDADSAYWIRTQLKPILPTRPVFDDFFFRPEQIIRERRVPRDAEGRYTWTGVYAVPVGSRDEPLPPHPLRVAIVRSNQDYARYVSSRRDPERREPVSNVTGAIGIVAGLSVDSVWVQVEGR